MKLRFAILILCLALSACSTSGTEEESDYDLNTSFSGQAPRTVRPKDSNAQFFNKQCVGNSNPYPVGTSYDCSFLDK